MYWPVGASPRIALSPIRLKAAVRHAAWQHSEVPFLKEKKKRIDYHYVSKVGIIENYDILTSLCLYVALISYKDYVFLLHNQEKVMKIYLL